MRATSWKRHHGRKKRMGAQRSMSKDGHRRSTRLRMLEEQKNDDGAYACRLDPWQIIQNIISTAAHGKKKKNGEIQKLQGEALSSQAIDAAYTGDKSGKGPTSDEIIEKILNNLELRDRLELFAMPDDIQGCDFEELTNKPGDFATLRQKKKDGMYQTLEQFENDVYMVFQKAISVNSPDTIPYREAMSLMEQAKQVFLSLKSHRMYSESELLAWRERQLDVGPNKPVRDQDDGNGVGGSLDIATASAQQRPNSTLVKKKATGTSAEKRQQISLGKKAGNVTADNGKAALKGAREGKNTPSPVKRARKAGEPGGARVGKRRLTYRDNADRGKGSTMMMPPPLTLPAFGDQRAGLVQHPQVQGHTYHDSLRRFVRHAGLRARLAAEFRILECDNRARQNPSPAPYWNGFATGGGSYYPPSPLSMSLQTPPSGGAVGKQAPAPECKLETDGLLALVAPMGSPEFLERGTPAFLERAKQVLRDTCGEGSSKGGRVTEVTAATPVSAQTNGASQSASAINFGPFAPPKLPPGRLGFGQFASSSAPPFKLKPPTQKKRE